MIEKYKEIKNKFKKRALERVLASSITTYKTGGEIDLIVYPENISEIKFIFDFINKNGIDFFILGKGSNILVSDKGFKGIFIGTSCLDKFSVKENIIYAQSGFSWDLLVKNSIDNDLAGLEKTSYIPGSVGGAVKMNAGAFGQETFDKLDSIEVLDIENGEIKNLDKKKLNYGYRYVGGIENFFIISAKFKMEYGNKYELEKIRKEIISRRKEKQPLEYPSAGSVFKRPENDYASKLIDSCGLKGLRIGGAMVSPKHAGFIINYDKATSEDIYRLIMKVKEEVFKKTGVKLELEQILIGKF